MFERRRAPATRGARLVRGLILALLAPFGCATATHPIPLGESTRDVVDSAAAFAWQLPPGFPVPRVPAANPMTPAKVELGRHLFFDPRLSGNGKQACATCHQPERAFTDGKAVAIGSTGERHPRSAMSLTNVAYNVTYTWADPRVRSLEDQALVPMLNRHPVELGLAGREDEVLARLATDPRYVALFRAAFPDAPATTRIGLREVTRAIASFERTLLSGDSAYDRLVYGGDRGGFGDAAWRGMTLFFSDRLKCSQCHGGFNLSGPVTFAGGPPARPAFHDTGLAGAGRFRAPTLRNVAVTAPYMHDGRFATLEDVVEHYARGGLARRRRSRLVAGFAITEAEKGDLVAFLRSLTDDGFLRDPRFRDPWSRSVGPAGP